MHTRVTLEQGTELSSQIVGFPGDKNKTRCKQMLKVTQGFKRIWMTLQNCID